MNLAQSDFIKCQRNGFCVVGLGLGLGPRGWAEIIKKPTWNDLHRNEHSFYAWSLISTAFNMHNAHYCIIKLHHLSIAQWDSHQHKSTNQATYTASDSVILLLIFLKSNCAVQYFYGILCSSIPMQTNGTANGKLEICFYDRLMSICSLLCLWTRTAFTLSYKIISMSCVSYSQYHDDSIANCRSANGS